MNIESLKEMFEDNWINSLKDEKSFFYFCSYVPIEIIHASNYKPVRFIVDSSPFLYTDEVIPKYLCPYLKSVIEVFIKNDLKDKNIVFTDGCDSSRRIFEVFKELEFTKRYFYLKIPFNEGKVDFEFLREEFTNFYEFLNGKVDYDKLIESIHLYNKGREKLKEILEKYKKKTSGLYKAYLNLFFQTMDIKDFLNLKIEPYGEENFKEKFYLFSTIYPVKFIEYVESLGYRLDYDDSCFGERNLSLVDLKIEDPIDSLVEYYLLREGCVRRREINKKIENIINRFKKGNFKGVLIYSLKYCDPLTFYIPILKEKLSKENIPILIIEDDFTLNIKGQIRTRIEAFGEMLR